MNVPRRSGRAGRKATAKDVAGETGVSKWTVNRAFRSDASIAEESRKRILAAADRLGYRPNLLARSLSTKTTQQVALLVDDFGNPHKLPVLKALTAALQREGLVATLINIDQPTDHVEAIRNADQRQVDAVVLLGTSFRDEILRERTLRPNSPPLYVLARESRLDIVTAICCDAIRSMREICEHLWARGYRRPAFMSGPPTLSTALGRMREFEAFWRARGVAPVAELPAGAYDRIAASEAMARYLSATPPDRRADVVMCENDALTFVAMDVARFAFGLKCPTDMAFVGYDGADAAAAPSYDLTTYEQPLGKMAALLVEMIVGRTKRASVDLEGRLIVRGSS
jgi:DNA-binding LacI/PurR family transcriptional regulator